MDTLTIIWTIIIVGFLLIEIMTPGLVSICFSIAGGVALIMHFLNFGLMAQLIGFAIALAISLYFLIPVLKKIAKIKPDQEDPVSLTNLDLVIGTVGIVLEEISYLEDGLVKVGGKEWTAKVEEEITIKQGSSVIVKEIKGAKIIVEPTESEE